MVGRSNIDIHYLNLNELVGVVNLYPWYGGARLELCRRMARMGDTWGEDPTCYLTDDEIREPE